MSVGSRRTIGTGWLCPGLAALVSLDAGAQLPLTISDLVVPQDSFKLTSRVAYTQLREPLVMAPNGVGAVAQQRSEIADFSTRLRWGATPALELDLRLAEQHLTSEAWPGPEASARRNRLDAGITWLANSEGEWPALLLSAEVTLAGSEFGDDSEYRWGRDQSLGLTVYRSLDPVVLSLSVAYSNRLPRQIGGLERSPGNVLSLQPRVNFAVNHRFSLVGGLSVRVQQVTRVDGRVVRPRETTLGAVLGLGLQMSGRSTLFATSEFVAVGNDAMSLSAEWVYRF